ncbi:MAG: lipocalin-like domain-containing protein [SAR202 cluster bacterium]|nr:lipocalin-like domain-containing protein [SAR202 cluster bacterium]
MSENRIVGAWKLISYEGHTDDEIFYPLGKDAFGYIMYTQDGYMSVTMCSLNRDSFSSEDLTGGTSAEKLQAASTYISYCGRYQLLGDRVIHKIEAALFPNRVGTEQVRYTEFEGDILTLSTDPMLMADKMRSGKIVWERVSLTN